MDVAGSEHRSENTECQTEGSLPQINHIFGMDIPKMELAPGMVFDANVCHSEGPRALFIHPWKYRGMILHFTKLLEFLYDETPPDFLTLGPRDMEIGSYCVARFEGDFYRAKILDRLSPASFKVEFVDFGNVTFVKFRDMRQLHPKFTLEAVTPFALRVEDYWGDQISRDVRMTVGEYDGLMDARIVTVKLEQELGEQAWKARVYAYADDEKHTLHKTKESDVTLHELDVKSGFYAVI